MKNNDCFVDDYNNTSDKKNKSDELLAIKVQIAKANLQLLNAKINKINNSIKNQNQVQLNKNQTTVVFD